MRWHVVGEGIPLSLFPKKNDSPGLSNERMRLSDKQKRPYVSLMSVRERGPLVDERVRVQPDFASASVRLGVLKHAFPPRLSAEQESSISVSISVSLMIQENSKVQSRFCMCEYMEEAEGDIGRR